MATETKMTDDELSLQVAMEIMGKRYINGHMDRPYYATDANAAREVEAEVARRGLHTEYVASLFRMFDLRAPVTERNLFDLITASPRSRCLAALRAVRGGE